MTLRFALGLGLFFLLQSTAAEARSVMERLDQLIFGRGKDLSAAYDAYDHGKFEEAAKDFSAFASGPQSNQVASYNAGVVSYKAGKPDDAMKFLQRAASGNDPKIKAKALHNVASIHIDKQELEPARDSLKEALSYDNDNKAIRENLEWVEEQLKKQPPNKDQDKKDSEKQADNKDKKDEQKSEEEKEEEQDASNKEKDPNKDSLSQDQQKAQDQKTAEEKKAEEKSAEEKKAEQDKQNGDKSKEQTAQDEEAKKENQSKDKAEKAQAAEEQKDKDQSKDPKNADGKKNQSVLTQAELKQQEAERLLRSIDDKIGRYPLTDTEATGQRGKDGKNW